MSGTAAQKRRQQATLREAVRIIRAEHPEVWASAYRRAKDTIIRDGIDDDG